MHKVTASAVILTAITGCSQGKAPSAEWSFEAPSETAAQLTLNQYSVFDNEDAIASSADGQQRLPNASRDKIGPAFEQPDGTAILPSARQSPANGKIADTAADEVLALSANQSRTDPIAQVRAYLSTANSPGSSSLLGNRVPYSSQVSLPAASIYTPAAAPAEATVPIISSPTLSRTFSSPLSEDAAQAVADFNNQPDGDLPRLQVSAAATELTALSPTASSPTPALLAPADTGFALITPSGAIEASPVFEDKLPALLAAQHQATLAERELSNGMTEQVSDRTFLPSESTLDESASIGAAILRSLQVNAALNSSPTEVPTVSITSASAAESRVAVESAESTLSSATSPTEGNLPRVIAQPTLSKLIQTIPQREEPLLLSFQTAQTNLRQVSTADSNTSWSNVSASQALVSQSVSSEALSAPAEQTAPQTMESEANRSPSEEINSPLLRGFKSLNDKRSDNKLGALQTLYMPIPTSPPAEISATLMHSVLSTLSDGINSAALLNDLRTGATTSLIDSLIPVDMLESAGPERNTAGTAREQPTQPDETAQLISFQIDEPRAHSAQGESLQGHRLGRFRTEKNSGSRISARVSAADGYRQRIGW